MVDLNGVFLANVYGACQFLHLSVPHVITPILTQEFIDKVAQRVAQHGIEYWDNVAIEALIPPKALHVHSVQGTRHWRKETDILDVWFDSGISHYAVLRTIPALQFPADIYAEGKDQHRGWFQSSLLTSIVLEA